MLRISTRIGLEVHVLSVHIIRIRILYYTTKFIYAIGRVKHESDRCGSAEPY